ncbi:MAG: hypothetical protein ACXVBX_01620 [Flavisolibacter sp.]
MGKVEKESKRETGNGKGERWKVKGGRKRANDKRETAIAKGERLLLKL